jgi:PKD domain/Enoyl-CoA hydratase/isomerase
MTARLPQLVGAAMARRPSMTGEVVDADRAERIGLVTEVLPHERLLGRAVELASQIAEVPAPIMVGLKEIYVRSPYCSTTRPQHRVPAPPSGVTPSGMSYALVRRQGDPRAPVNLADQGPRHSLDQVVGDRAGGVIVIETVRDGSTSRSFATAFDATPPEIIAPTVPTTVTVNQVVQLRSRFSDTWSPMGPIAWDFGDGTPPGAGATVTHSWAAPGPYLVTLTGQDVRGNTATRTFTVTVS